MPHVVVGLNIKKLQIIEKNTTIKFSQNIADTIWIYATYRIFDFSVKP